MQRPEADRLFIDFSKWSADYWKISFALAVSVHLFAFVLLLVSPYLHRRPLLFDVQTVNLFTAEEIELPKPAAAKPEPTPPPAAAKMLKPEPPPVSVAPAPEPAVAQPAVSLKPLKKKERVPSPKEELKVKQTMLERKLRQVQARIEQQQAEATVKKEVGTALERIRQSLTSRAPAVSSPS